MENKKLLILLVAFVVLVNYINYFLPDRDKLHKQELLLEKKIAKEKLLNTKKIDPKELEFPYEGYFYDGKKLNYSQAMGKLQELLNKSAKGLCDVKHLRWAQVPASKEKYQPLKIHLSLGCTPKNGFKFMNKLKDEKKLLKIENIRISKPRREAKVNMVMQIVAYRSVDVK